LAQITPWFIERGVRVAAVTLGKAYEAKMFCAQRSPQIVCLSNPDQSAYQMYGIGRAGARELFNPMVTFAGVRAATKGFLPSSTDTDMLQLSATFVIDASGFVRYAHYNKHVADHPKMAKLKEVVETLL
jgi:peroxiredoxin